MPVVANLVLGADGSSRWGVDSQGISTPEDRAHFLAERRKRDCIIIGGKTAANFGYRKSPCPVIVLSRDNPALPKENPRAHWWQESPADAIARAGKEFGPNIGIEGGPTLLLAFLEDGLIDLLQLSVTPIIGGENLVDSSELLSYFQEIKKTQIGETIFYAATQPIKRSR